jgi:ketosteroid isomerase-like protein
MPIPLLVVTLLLNGQAAPKPVTPEDVVKQFFDAYQRLDVDGMTAVMAPDMVFDDPTFRLHANSRAEWRKQAEGNRLVITHIGIEVHSTVRSGDTIATELTLSGGIKQKDGRVSPFKVRGASFFRVRNGLITHWTDYMDFRTFSEQTRPPR